MDGRSHSQPGTYLAQVIMLLFGAGMLLPALAPPSQPVRAAAVFGSQPLDGSRFAILARPVAQQDWTLLVLEQVQPAPRCWEERADGLVDPSLNRFDFSGICSRYLDSNGYSLRTGDLDQGSRYRLRLRQRGQELQLQAFSAGMGMELVVARGAVPLRDRDGFVALTLEPGWQLQRRTYGSQTLSHVYFANPQPMEQLVAASERTGRQADWSKLPDPMQNLPSLPIVDGPRSTTGPVALQVIPFNR